MTNLKTTIASIALLIAASTLMAETKVSVYSVPFGLVGDVSAMNFRAFEKRLDNIPSAVFTLQEKDSVLAADGITIVLDDKEDKVENYNKILAALYSYAKVTPGADLNAIRQAVGVLAIKKDELEK